MASKCGTPLRWQDVEEPPVFTMYSMPLSTACLKRSVK